MHLHAEAAADDNLLARKARLGALRRPLHQRLGVGGEGFFVGDLRSDERLQAQEAEVGMRAQQRKCLGKRVRIKTEFGFLAAGSYELVGVRLDAGVEAKKKPDGE